MDKLVSYGFIDSPLFINQAIMPSLYLNNIAVFLEYLLNYLDTWFIQVSVLIGIKSHLYCIHYKQSLTKMIFIN